MRVAPIAVALASFTLAGAAHAQDEGGAPEPPRRLTLQPLRERPENETAEAPRKHAEERPFVYTLDPSTPTRGDVTLEYAAGMASGVAADRPLPSSVTSDGITHAATVGYGATDRIAPFVTVRVLQPGDQGAAHAGGAAGLRWQLTKPGAPFRLTLMAAGARETEGTMTTYGRIAASYDYQRLRIAANVHGEHAFARGRDGIDVLVFGGVSYRALDMFRVGAEYVGQDLEEAFDRDQAEGGAKHYAGPTFAFDGDTFQLVAGPAFGLTQASSRMMGRAALVVAF